MKLPINVVILETNDSLTNTIDRKMYVTDNNSKIDQNKILYKIIGNHSLILESLIRLYGYENININELNESDSLSYMMSLETISN